MSTKTETAPFSKWRQRLWPFHRYEMNKLLPLLLMKFFISLNYCIFFSLKDTITVTAEHSGAEVLNVLKGAVVFPTALIAAFCYGKASRFFSKQTLFYGTVSVFLFLIGIYGFFLAPNEAFLSPSSSADFLLSLVSKEHAHWVAIYRNWIHSLFFALAELWGTVIILVVFWGLANDITTVDEAKRSYVIYIAAGDLAMLSVGGFVHWISPYLSHLPYIVTVQALISISLLVGVLILLTYWWINRTVISDPRFSIPKQDLPPQKKKIKVSFSQGLFHLISSPHLLSIVILVIGYGACMILVETPWKANIKQAFPKPADYQALTSKCQFLVGLFSFIVTALFGSSLMRKFRWRFMAQLTPLIVGGASFIFLLLSSYPSLLSRVAPLFGLSPLHFLVNLGAIHNVTSKVAKYSFFDPTKEIAYIPLSEEEKTQGKASIDIVGSRLGKSGASWIQLGLIDLVGSGSSLSTTHFLAPIVFVILVAWFYAIHSLSKKLDQEKDRLVAL